MKYDWFWLIEDNQLVESFYNYFSFWPNEDVSESHNLVIRPIHPSAGRQAGPIMTTTIPHQIALQHQT